MIYLLVCYFVRYIGNSIPLKNLLFCFYPLFLTIDISR